MDGDLEKLSVEIGEGKEVFLEKQLLEHEVLSFIEFVRVREKPLNLVGFGNGEQISSVYLYCFMFVDQQCQFHILVIVSQVSNCETTDDCVFAEIPDQSQVNVSSGNEEQLSGVRERAVDD